MPHEHHCFLSIFEKNFFCNQQIRLTTGHKNREFSLKIQWSDLKNSVYNCNHFTCKGVWKYYVINHIISKYYCCYLLYCYHISQTDKLVYTNLKSILTSEVTWWHVQRSSFVKKKVRTRRRTLVLYTRFNFFKNTLSLFIFFFKIICLILCQLANYLEGSNRSDHIQRSMNVL